MPPASRGGLLPPVRRRIAAPLASIVICVGATACGGSTTPSSSEVRPTSHAAAAYAHAVNLTAADLPEASPTSPRPPSATVERAAARCAGAVNPDRRVADIESAGFRIGSGREPAKVFLESDVVVFPTAALARSNLTAYFSHRGQACIAALPDSPTLRSPDKITFGHQTVIRVPVPLRSASEEAGIRITAPVALTIPASSLPSGAIKGKRLQIAPRTLRYLEYWESFAFRVGAAEVLLSCTRAHEPTPTSIVQRLLTLLYNRARARKL
jgi:hypothetical protein